MHATGPLLQREGQAYIRDATGSRFPGGLPSVHISAHADVQVLRGVCVPHPASYLDSAAGLEVIIDAGSRMTRTPVTAAKCLSSVG